jgi:hypothetical protein
VHRSVNTTRSYHVEAGGFAPRMVRPSSYKDVPRAARVHPKRRQVAPTRTAR